MFTFGWTLKSQGVVLLPLGHDRRKSEPARWARWEEGGVQQSPHPHMPGTQREGDTSR